MSLRDEILVQLRAESASAGLSESELAVRMGLPKHLKRRVIQALQGLVEEGKIKNDARHRYMLKDALPGAKAGLTGRFRLLGSGDGVIRDEAAQEYFVPERFRGWALPGDEVEFRRLPPQPGRGDKSRRDSGRVTRPGAVIQRVLARGQVQLVGALEREGGEAYLLLRSGDWDIPVLVMGVGPEVPEGDYIVASPPGLDIDGKEPETARFLSHLGGEDTPHLDTLILIKKAGLREEFSPASEREAQALPPNPGAADFEGRFDLRDQAVFTIDGADAKDFDDAVSIERQDQGWRLGVHIADVSHYVRPGSPLDKEAWLRATSVYLPDRVLPMLPEALSNGLCSLRPGVPRLTLSAFMNFDARGQMTGYDFAESVIHSARRFTYDEVEAFLMQGQSFGPETQALGPVLSEMRRLALARRERREERGALDFNFPETKVVLDAQGDTLALLRRERLFAHQLIEEFMLAANEAVASKLKDLDAPFLYRVHEKPDEDKLADTLNLLGRMKLGVPKGSVTPKDLQKLLKRVEGKPEEKLAHNLILRSLRLAKYQKNHDIHFGLALENYCHFTSPIRRYPDLLVHRSLRSAVLARQKLGETRAILGDLSVAGLHTSDMERKAEACERDCIKAKQIRYLQKKIGEEFDAVVQSVTPFGFFAEIKDFPAEGLVPMASLPEYFLFEQEWMRLRARASGKTYSIGDPVRIRVKRADWKSLKADFEVLD